LKILIDENLSKLLARQLSDLGANHCVDLGWQGLSNGRLMGAMKTDGFSVLVTADKNLRHQQNLGASGCSVVLLDIHPTSEANQLHCVDEIREACLGIKPGEVRVVLGPHPKRLP
jgi:predicted nuclease of predicted toxin-antitoxin system